MRERSLEEKNDRVVNNTIGDSYPVPLIFRRSMAFPPSMIVFLLDMF